MGKGFGGAVQRKSGEYEAHLQSGGGEREEEGEGEGEGGAREWHATRFNPKRST